MRKRRRRKERKVEEEKKARSWRVRLERGGSSSRLEPDSTLMEYPGTAEGRRRGEEEEEKKR